MLRKRESRRKRELKQYKICLEPPNLIYTTNREERREGKNGGDKGEKEKKEKNANWLQLGMSGLR